jgi:hypothetical protein
VHDDLVALVERMLELNRRLQGAVGREREELEKKIERMDGEINGLVYRLMTLRWKNKSSWRLKHEATWATHSRASC